MLKNNLVENKKLIALGVGILFLGVFTVGIVDAEFWGCFEQGEVIHYCDAIFKNGTSKGHPYRPDEIYSGNFPKCMSLYDQVENCYVHGTWNKCNQIPQECGNFGGNTTYDLTPPEFNLTNPKNDSVFSSTRALVEFTLDEKSDVSYSDLNLVPQRWIRVCSDCKFYSRELNFKEGLNEIIFRATDSVGNENYTAVKFNVDSRLPSIRMTLPRSGEYSAGEFLVQFSENNPQDLKLKIDYSGGTDEYLADLENDCTESRGLNSCEVEIDVEKYDGEEVDYYFELTDIANNTVFSRKSSVKVDSSAPIINSIDYYVSGRSYYFVVNFTEEFPYSVEYLDLNDPRARPRSLCRNFNDGVCEGRVTLRDGDYNLQFILTDEAGASDEESISLLIDTTKPRIYRTYPYRGFSDGNFDVDFLETNPESLILHYEDKESQVDLNSCSDNRGRSFCSVSVNLSEFDSEDILYYFELIDVTGNEVKSRPVKVSVDITSPVLENDDSFFEVDGRYVYFSLNVTEENLDKVVYFYESNGRVYERTLCTRLNSDGLCERRVSFRRGTYNVNVQINDDANNFIGVSTGEFEIQ